jgi:serine/threonine protein kinase
VLSGAPEQKKELTWVVRLKIALDAARGLLYMHGTCSPPAIHRDFKSGNILLAADFTAKVTRRAVLLKLPVVQQILRR